MRLSAEYADKVAELDMLLANMPPRRRINLLLQVGIPADTVMGVEHCTDHKGGRLLGTQEPLAFDGSVVWCKGCFRWLRI